MATLRDVQDRLLQMYHDASRAEEHGLDCKMCDGCITIRFPSWGDRDVVDYHEPNSLEIYSYALGPNRQHYVSKGERLRQLSSDQWEGPCLYETALAMLDSWEKPVNENQPKSGSDMQP